MAESSSVREMLVNNNIFDGTNFPEWERNLRQALDCQNIQYVLDRPLEPEPPRSNVTQWTLWETHHDDNITAQCIMLESMIPECRRHCKAFTAYEMMTVLHDLHLAYLEKERYEISENVFRSRMTDDMSVETHVWHMIARFNRLDALGAHFPPELKENLILHSLPDSWEDFIMKYLRLNKSLTLKELMAMLVAAEPEIKSGKKQKAQLVKTSKKSKGKTVEYPKASGGINKPKSGQSSSGKVKDKSQDVCLYCRELGHWKRDCPRYKADLEEKQAGKAPASGIMVTSSPILILGFRFWT